MMDGIEITSITRKGVAIEITSMAHGMLVQGGICGRRVWYSWDRIENANANIANDFDLMYLLEYWVPNRVLRRGDIIR